MGDVLLKDIPEFFEVDLGESLAARTEALPTFRELGPPDLCQYVKQVSGAKTSSKELGSYHYVSGVDASSSATLAAYINSLTYSFEDTSLWFARTPYRITSGVFCSFNAFSRIDIRCVVTIPGGVEAYAVDLRGDRHEISEELWRETYLSAVLRAILYADDAAYRLAGFRRLDVIKSIDEEQKFLKAAEALFFRGWQLGSDPEIQVATTASNHLTSGLMKYFGECFRFARLIPLFERLREKDDSVSSLLAQAYIGMNEEVKAIKILHIGLKEDPQSYALLHVQVDFLRSKKKYSWALKLAKHAVNCAPSEFVSWAKLTECYIDLGDYRSALLTLNSCPMFTYNERDLHRMPSPARTHLPIKQFILDSKILDSDLGRDHEADVTLLRLPAPGLRGTFNKAYALLTKLVSQIGWDELLKCRSTVFVMEEEYRMQKQQTDGKAETSSLHPAHNGEENDSDASTKALKEDGKDRERRTPSIHIEDTNGEEKSLEHDMEEVSLAADPIDQPKPASIALPGAGAEAGEGAGLTDGAARATNGRDEYNFSFHNKRLCERWLDNLFMVLYEDLRVFTIWRAELLHFKQQGLVYRKTGTEWEILADLAFRLHHREEAKAAYIQCIENRFSVRAWSQLLEMYSAEGDAARTINAAVRLVVHNSRWYLEATYPTAVAHNIYSVVQSQGLSKLHNMLISMNLPKPIFDLMVKYFQVAEWLKIPGHDW